MCARVDPHAGGKRSSSLARAIPAMNGLRGIIKKRSAPCDVRTVLLLFKFHSFVRLNSSELLTTNTELNAIAAPAIIGESRPAAATGIPIIL